VGSHGAAGCLFGAAFDGFANFHVESPVVLNAAYSAVESRNPSGVGVLSVNASPVYAHCAQQSNGKTKQIEGLL
jgi:hypothetical protein